MDKPYGIPADFSEHFKLMSNMIAIAFQADQTRVVTFLMTREGSSRPIANWKFRTVTILSLTTATYPTFMEKVRKMNEYHVRQFAGFIEKMKSTKEGDGSYF